MRNQILFDHATGEYDAETIKAYADAMDIQFVASKLLTCASAITKKIASSSQSDLDGYLKKIEVANKKRRVDDSSEPPRDL